MFRNYRPSFAACLSLCVLLTAGTSFADYIGRYISPNGSPPIDGIVRITDSGLTVPTNFHVQPPFGDYEHLAQGIAVTPDLQKVYSFTETLGFANHILAWDTASSAFRPSDSFTPSGVGNDYVLNARQPMIVGNEMLVISRIFHGSNFVDEWQVKRYNLATHALLQTLDPLLPQELNDIALDPSGSVLYVAGSSGIYRSTKSQSGYQSLILPLIPGIDGNIALGPNNLLYVRNFANGDIERYTATGTFLDTLISHNDYPGLNTIQFGVDGNLHVYQGSGRQIRKFDPSTGVLLSSTPAGPIYLSFSDREGRIFYIPVPEPSTLLLFAVCALLLPSFRPKRRISP